MRFQLVVTNHPTSDISRPSVFVSDFVTGKRHIIGHVPEGLQRQCIQIGVRTSRVDSIYLTGIADWKSLSGLPGFILTVGDQGVKDLNIFHSGNRVIKFLVSSWRYFVFRLGLRFVIEDIDVHKSGEYQIKAINITRSDDAPGKTNDNEFLKHISELLRHMFGLKYELGANGRFLTKIALPWTFYHPKVSANYIMTGNAVRGRFLVEKAIELGCPKRQFRDLCAFKTVTLEDGTVIKPEDVLEPSKRFDSALFLDIPGEEYLENTINHDWQADLEEGKYTLVYHFIDDSVKNILERPEYQKFIQSFDPTTVHLISHKQYVPDALNYLSSYTSSLKWHMLLPEYFPLFRWSDVGELPIPKELTNVLPMVRGQSAGIESGAPAAVERKFPTTKDEVRTFLKHVYQQDVVPANVPNYPSEEEFVNAAFKPAGKKLGVAPDLSKPLKDQVELLVLGTGSAIPSKLRNVISTCVRIPTETGFRTLILDAGENTLGTIEKLYSPEDTERLFKELKIVFLSHLHADHHIGIISLLNKWNTVRSEHDKLFVVAPWQYAKFVREVQRLDDTLDLTGIEYLSCDEFNQDMILPEHEQAPLEDVSHLDLRTVTCETLELEPNAALQQQLLERAGLRSFRTCYATHCDYSYSCALDFDVGAESFKVAYSGDTRPKLQFAEISEGCDLLIHESTLEDKKYQDAIDKKHSTTSEALQMGILMQAKKILFTHFSQRYRYFSNSSQVYNKLANPTKVRTAVEKVSPIFKAPLSPEMVENAPQIETIFAVDNMHIELGNFDLQRPVFERIGDKLERLFNADVEDESEQVESHYYSKKRKAS
ncbi:hypothetical protein OGAPHI_000673 [Ogataea philodendri]|uniref:ribonuclease Z n=1 Tax=Ogataea philodendri TaxID=1378263 RepID=A0A9P8PGQ7_9ASCO|nr:uncharacterized protein OGAPHI_000673 [Ogataea philodendri]KAH3670962.1 hypothetical protein OGAPHI_000673 [Ogataea philodendri]